MPELLDRCADVALIAVAHEVQPHSYGADEPLLEPNDPQPLFQRAECHHRGCHGSGVRPGARHRDLARQAGEATGRARGHPGLPVL